MTEQRPALRLSDRDRDAAVTALGEHFAEGRLTREEYDERTEQAWAARTAAQLRPLFADLPGPATAAAAPAPAPGPVASDGHPGWRFGAVALPVLLALVALSALTHFPVFLLVFFAWFVFARSGHHWAHAAQRRRLSGPGYGGWSTGQRGPRRPR